MTRTQTIAQEHEQWREEVRRITEPAFDKVAREEFAIGTRVRFYYGKKPVYGTVVDHGTRYRGEKLFTGGGFLTPWSQCITVQADGYKKTKQVYPGELELDV